MLTHLHIENFAIVKKLELDFASGMTAITGETGAGKSIALDALGLCLGERAEATMVRPSEEKADISAIFALNQHPQAQDWLQQHEFAEGDECIIRRVITKEGRSRGFINGRPASLSQLKTIGQLLIQIHGQHAHHFLIKKDQQLHLLDQYAGHQDLLKQMKSAHKEWQNAIGQHKQWLLEYEQNSAQKQLLDYQIKELDELGCGENEYTELEQEYQELSNCEQIAQCCHQALQMLSSHESNDVLSMLHQSQQKLIEIAELSPKQQGLSNLLNEAIIIVEEAQHEINHVFEGLDADPNRLSYVDARFSKLMSLARKHHVPPEQLYDHHQQLKQAISQFKDFEDTSAVLEQNIATAKQEMLAVAQTLSLSRQRAAQHLDRLITSQVRELNMDKAQFTIALTQDDQQASALGFDTAVFMISINTGQPLQPIAKVASGGELSRLSLAIQVITAQKIATPSLIFDEVDVGISGITATIVGQMLRRLAKSTQVLCVTHLPQVAANGHNHMFVSKKMRQNSTETHMVSLNTEQRIEELARLLAGTQITATTLANARELLAAA